MADVDQAIVDLAKYVGIAPVFKDLENVAQPTSRETNLALLKACGWELDNDASILEAIKFSNSQRQNRLFSEEIVSLIDMPLDIKVPSLVTWRLELEDQTAKPIEGKTDTNIEFNSLPIGIHRLVICHAKNTETVRLIIAPATAPSVKEMTGAERLWGINAALYGLHSNRNPSLGDYEDLATLSRDVAEHGASFIGINPVHAIGWQSDEVISPYSPTHRGFLNTNHIALDKIEPISEKSLALISKWKEQSRTQVNEFVDYAFYLKHQKNILKSLHVDFREIASPDQKLAFKKFSESLPSLNAFTEFEVLSENHGTDWRQWPTHLQAPSLASSIEAEQTFHAWLQWQAEIQLNSANDSARAAGLGLGLYLDLAVGSRRNGAEAWSEKDSIAQGVSVGAPPDYLSPAGQNWDLCAFAPQKLAANDYRAFRNILASNMRHCGVLRIDHVLGLNRSFWIPDDGSRGGYIYQNFEAMLAILKIEAVRNHTVIIGEDLGLVPKGFRSSLNQNGIYSYSVLQYEKNNAGKFKKPSSFHKRTLACFGTHDTPTLSGYENGIDISWWQKLDWIDEAGAIVSQQNRKTECADLLALNGKNKINAKSNYQKHLGLLNSTVHELLASSPVALVTVQLDDIEQQRNAQNIPGTINEHPNWRRRYSTSVNDLTNNISLSAIGKLMNESGRSGIKISNAIDDNAS